MHCLAAFLEALITMVVKATASMCGNAIHNKITLHVERNIDKLSYKILNKSKSRGESKRLSAQFVESKAGTMRAGEKAVFGPSALKYDSNHKAWIDPESIPSTISPGEHLVKMVGEPILQLERTPDGFKVDMRSAQGVFWAPEPKDKLAGWIPITEFVE